MVVDISLSPEASVSTSAADNGAGSFGLTVHFTLNSCLMTSRLWQQGHVTSIGLLIGAMIGTACDVDACVRRPIIPSLM